MADEELEILRAQRLRELQQQKAAAAGTKNQAASEEEQKEREAEFRNHILSQVLSQAARSRLSTISIAKPENGKMLENMIITMARTGQIQSKLSDEEFVELLEQVNRRIQQKAPNVKFDRRRAGLDSDED